MRIKEPKFKGFLGRKKILISKILMILVLESLSTLLFYSTGGTKYVYTHIMYIPIMLAAFFFDIKGVLIVAIIGGLSIGPFFPKRMDRGIDATSEEWILRMAMFVIVGVFFAIIIRRMKKAEIDKAFVNILTNYPNINKLQYDITSLVERKVPFSAIGFKVTNIDGIKQNISYDVAVKILIRLMEILKEMTGSEVYSIFASDFVVILENTDCNLAKEIADEFVERTMGSLDFDGYRVGVLLRGVIVNYPEHMNTALGVVQKLGTAMYYFNEEIGVFVYNQEMEKTSKIRNDMVPMLLNALKNNEFVMVYQPEIDIKNEKIITRIESLIRWKHPTLGLISPGDFIKSAEEIGLIGEITKFVIREVTNKVMEWKKLGIKIPVAINISIKDLATYSELGFFKNLFTNNNGEYSMLEIELTETSSARDSNMVIPILEKVRSKGIKIGLDDFGTGYNSIMKLFSFPMDYIKIDKMFIARMNEKKFRITVKALIDIAHSMGKTVVAEGVETKEQFELLKEFGCDSAQGYYISRPVSDKELVEFVKKYTS